METGIAEQKLVSVAAGLAHGIYQESGLFTGAAKRQFYPRMERQERDARYLGWKDAVNMLQ